MVPYELTTYTDVVNRALIIEREINKKYAKKERNQRKRIRSNDMQEKNSRNIKDPTKRSTDSKAQRTDNERCSRCGQNHADKDYRWIKSACFNYGQMDYKIANCLQKIGNQFAQKTYDGQNNIDRGQKP